MVKPKNTMASAKGHLGADDICLRPDKINHFVIGLSKSPEGWWDCVSYLTDAGNGYKCFEVMWDMSYENKKHFLWLKGLTLNPPKIQLDRFWMQLVDHSTPNSMGYGPAHFIKQLKTIDDVLEFMSTHPLLKDFFFTEEERQMLKLNHYVTR